jgi:hypothetical protein
VGFGFRPLDSLGRNVPAHANALGRWKCQRGRNGTVPVRVDGLAYIISNLGIAQSGGPKSEPEC